MVFTDTVTLTTGSSGITGTEVAYQFTSAFQPKLGQATPNIHQPNGMVQMAALYGLYQVQKCIAICRFTTASSDLMVLAGIRLQGSPSTTATNADRVSEYNGIYPRLCTANGDKEMIEMKFDLRPWEALGLTKGQYLFDKNNTGAAVTATPTLIPLLVVNVGSLVGASGQTVTCTTTLVMDTLFSERTIELASTV